MGKISFYHIQADQSDTLCDCWFHQVSLILPTDGNCDVLTLHYHPGLSNASVQCRVLQNNLLRSKPVCSLPRKAFVDFFLCVCNPKMPSSLNKIAYFNYYQQNSSSYILAGSCILFSWVLEGS